MPGPPATLLASAAGAPHIPFERATMRRLAGAAAAIACALNGAAPASAQGGWNGSWVTPPGLVSFGAGLDFSDAGARFGRTGREGLLETFGGPLTPATFSPLAPLSDDLAAFFAGTGGSLEVRDEDVTAGTLSVEAGGSVRLVPLDLRIGVLPGLELSARIPFQRSEFTVRRLELTGGRVGLNPDPDANAEVLSAVGPEFERLGGATFLPIADSPLGRALQERVTANDSTATLLLPDSALDAAGLESLLEAEAGAPVLASGRTPWRAGDLELGGAFRVLGSFGAHPFPTDSAPVHHRLTVSGAIRLPTGSEGDTVLATAGTPTAGVSGWRVGADGDLFSGGLWLSAGMDLASFGEAEVRRATPLNAPLSRLGAPGAVRWRRGSELRLRLSPRYRIEEALAIGAEYEMARTAEARISTELGALRLGGGTAHLLGATLRYSTAASHLRGGAAVPAEVTLTFLSAFAGPEGTPVRSRLAVEARILARILGDGR